MNSRGLMLLAVPLVAGTALISSLALRHSAGPEAAPRPKAAVAAPVAPPSPAPVRPASYVPSKPVADSAIAQATDDARVRSTYRNFRTAVATDNRLLQDALLRPLLRDRETAVRLAEQEMTEAPSETDREIARKTLEALRR